MSDFYKRFDTPISIEEARKRFVARVCNSIFDNWNLLYSKLPPLALNMILRPIASELGIRYNANFRSIYDFINTDNYFEVLRGVEIIYKKGSLPNMKLVIDGDMNDYIISKSELDLGIVWKDGKFFPKGAESLDNELVNNPLKWLRANEYSTVIEPFEKAFRHFIGAELRPEILSDVITDAYEALEALSLILVGKSNLRGNQELFIKKINGNDFHKKILKEYVDYGCDYRHAADPQSPRPQPSKAEAEFFLYFTGTVLRLAMENG